MKNLALIKVTHGQNSLILLGALLFSSSLLANMHTIKEKESTSLISLKRININRTVVDFTFISTTTLLQEKPIIGIVADAKGFLPGVTVLLKGTDTSVVSGDDGSFVISAKDGDVLVFSFLGYSTMEVVVAPQQNYSITMTEDAMTLQEVTVNAGYYKVNDRDRTGSIATIKAADIEKQPVTNVLATMQGRMAGVDITQETGVPGGGFSVKIRGLNSLRNDGNSPLYIIDGVPYSSDAISDRQTSTSIPGDGNPLSSINPNDIESLDVLKDADATAIYGSRGANGVVLITTKKGKAGKAHFTFSSLYGVGKVTRFMNLMNTADYLAMRTAAFANDGYTEFPAGSYDVDGTWSATRYTDWQKELLGGSAAFTSIQGSVSGGSAQTRYLASGHYREEKTVFPGDFTYKKGGARISMDHTSLDSKFKLHFSGSYTTQNNSLPWIDFVTLSRQLAPNAPTLYNEDGSLNWENSTWINPLSNLESTSLAHTNDLLSNAVISYHVLPNVEVKTSLGFTDLQNAESRTVPSTLYDPAYQLGSEYSSIYTLDYSRRSWIVEPQVNWKKSFGVHAFNVLVGSTFQSQSSSSLSLLGEGFTSNNLLYDMASASRVKVLRNDDVLYRYQAVFGRLNYTLADRYIINFTGRRDGSSRFGQGKQFANFGAVGLAWLFYKNEALVEIQDVLSFGKLRGSFGTSGNDQIGDYQFMDTYTTSGYQYGSVNGLQPARLYNRDFGWESNTKLEGALELGFLKDRLFLTAALYRNQSDNQLVGLPLPGTTGFTSIQANLDATVRNKGFEFTLRTVNVKSPNFEWSTNLNFTSASNKLVSFPGLENSSYRNDYVIGQPTTIRKLFHFTSVNPQTGLYEFEDVNGDGVVTFEDDRETVKDFNPKFYGGLQNQLSYKGLKLDFLFQFVKQQNFNFAHTQRYAGLMGNQPSAYSNSWLQAGDVTPYQLFTTGVNQEAMQASEYFAYSDGAVSDASFIRLKNIALIYDFPKNAIKGIGYQISLQAQNLLTITKYDGADPEFVQPGSLPPLRIISAGMQLTF